MSELKTVQDAVRTQVMTAMTALKPLLEAALVNRPDRDYLTRYLCKALYLGSDLRVLFLQALERFKGRGSTEKLAQLLEQLLPKLEPVTIIPTAPVSTADGTVQTLNVALAGVVLNDMGVREAKRVHRAGGDSTPATPRTPMRTPMSSKALAHASGQLPAYGAGMADAMDVGGSQGDASSSVAAGDEDDEDDTGDAAVDGDGDEGEGEGEEEEEEADGGEDAEDDDNDLIRDVAGADNEDREPVPGDDDDAVAPDAAGADGAADASAGARGRVRPPGRSNRSGKKASKSRRSGAKSGGTVVDDDVTAYANIDLDEEQEQLGEVERKTVSATKLDPSTYVSDCVMSATDAVCDLDRLSVVMQRKMMMMNVGRVSLDATRLMSECVRMRLVDLIRSVDVKRGREVTAANAAQVLRLGDDVVVLQGRQPLAVAQQSAAAASAAANGLSMAELERTGGDGSTAADRAALRAASGTLRHRRVARGGTIGSSQLPIANPSNALYKAAYAFLTAIAKPGAQPVPNADKRTVAAQGIVIQRNYNRAAEALERLRASGTASAAEIKQKTDEVNGLVVRAESLFTSALESRYGRADNLELWLSGADAARPAVALADLMRVLDTDVQRHSYAPREFVALRKTATS